MQRPNGVNGIRRSQYKQERFRCGAGYCIVCLCLLLCLFLTRTVSAQSPAPLPSVEPSGGKSAAPSPVPAPQKEALTQTPDTEESDWMKEAEKGTERDRVTSRNFYRRIVITLFSLVIVSVIALLVLRFIYAKQGLLPKALARDKLIRVVEKHMLMPQKALYLVEVAGKYVLLGISENRIEYLMEVEGERIGQPSTEAPQGDPMEYLQKYSFPAPVQFIFSKMLQEKKK